MPAITPNGILDNHRRASVEKGAVYLDRLADFLVSKIGAKQFRRN